jgi:cyanophycinase
MEGITMKRFIILLFSCCAFVSVAVALADYDHSATVGPEKGWLLIHGGGRLTENAKSRFVALAGGTDANFVLIPTALADEEIDLDKAWNSFSRWSGAKHVTVLHTRNRKRANSDDFVEPLKHASGVWIDGGRQWRLADAYLGTAVEREIKALLARGGVVGGSSAGATIQGSYLIRGASGTARNPNGDNTVMMSPGHEKGFGLLPNSAIDQHVITRHREGDLDAVIASHPELLGIGIDESAAIVVHGDAFEVIEGQVVIHDGSKHANGNSYYLLSPGQKFDLKRRKNVSLGEGGEGTARPIWQTGRGEYGAASSELIPLFPRTLSGYRFENDNDFWNKPFPSRGSIRVFSGDEWQGLQNFPNTMNGCAAGVFMIRWRASDPEVRVQSSVRFSTKDASATMKSGSFGYMSGSNCEQPMFKFGDTDNGNKSTLVDIYYELRFWQAAP